MANSLSFPQGPWQALLKQAYQLLDEIAANGIVLPPWSLGGGTVLMFHYLHRRSKDIDIFVPDPQFLGFVNPRLGGPAEAVTMDYQDGAEYIKLFLPQGEIDFVAATALTANPVEEYEVLGRTILLETPLEIVAKKIWHRGKQATPRDLLDLALVIEHHPDGITQYRHIFTKHLATFISQCEARRAVMEPAFNAIDKIEFSLEYDECLSRVKSLI